MRRRASSRRNFAVGYKLIKNSVRLKAGIDIHSLRHSWCSAYSGSLDK